MISRRSFLQLLGLTGAAALTLPGHVKGLLVEPAAVIPLDAIETDMWLRLGGVDLSHQLREILMRNDRELRDVTTFGDDYRRFSMGELRRTTIDLEMLDELPRSVVRMDNTVVPLEFGYRPAAVSYRCNALVCSLSVKHPPGVDVRQAALGQTTIALLVDGATLVKS